MKTRFESRVYSIDLIKTIASFSVAAVHFRNRLENKIPVDLVTSKITAAFSLDYAVFIIAVPLFLLATGFLSSKRTVSSKYYKQILYVYSLYFFSALAVYPFMVRFGGWEALPLRMIILNAMSFKLISGWYIELYIGLALLIPYLNKWINALDKKTHRNLILTMFVLSSIPQFINSNPLLSVYLYIPNFYTSLYPIVYYLIGSYIYRYQDEMKEIKNGTLLLMYIISTLMIFCIVYITASPYTSSSADGYYGSIIEIISATALFLLIFKNSKTLGSHKLIQVFSKHTLSTYIMAYPVDKIMYPMLIKWIVYPVGLIKFMPLVSVASFLLSFIMGYIFTKVFNGCISFLKKSYGLIKNH